MCQFPSGLFLASRLRNESFFYKQYAENYELIIDIIRKQTVHFLLFDWWLLSILANLRFTFFAHSRVSYLVGCSPTSQQLIIH